MNDIKPGDEVEATSGAYKGQRGRVRELGHSLVFGCRPGYARVSFPGWEAYGIWVSRRVLTVLDPAKSPTDR